MILINRQYLHLFKKILNEYMYPVDKGIYLAFNIDNLNYIGLEMFYTPWEVRSIYKKEDMLLNDLLSKGILESR
mgnify:CR=1 FL=1